MQIPTSAPVSTIAPISGVDAALHTFVGVSWHILLPYTLFGALVMIYSQNRLMRGQRIINREARADSDSANANPVHE
jgi:hypothetical protein